MIKGTYEYNMSSLEDRFFCNVSKGDGCWLWTGSTTEDGYGVIKDKQKTVRTHRVSWEIHNSKPIPDGLSVLHECDNPPCVNPSHLRLGTPGDNMIDKMLKGRCRVGSDNGSSKLTEEDVRGIKAMLIDETPELVIAEKYSVSRSAINRIKLNKYWRHVK